MISLSVLRIDAFAKRLLLILTIVPGIVLMPLLQACSGEGNTGEGTPERNPMSFEPHQDDVMPYQAIKNRGLTDLGSKRPSV